MWSANSGWLHAASMPPASDVRKNLRTEPQQGGSGSENGRTQLSLWGREMELPTRGAWRKVACPPPRLHTGKMPVPDSATCRRFPTTGPKVTASKTLRSTSAISSRISPAASYPSSAGWGISLSRETNRAAEKDQTGWLIPNWKKSRRNVDRFPSEYANMGSL